MSVLRSYSGIFTREICFKNKLAFSELLLPKTTFFPSGTRDELVFVVVVAAASDRVPLEM